MLEKDIVSEIMRYLKTVPECFFFKEHGGMYGTAGIPDLICCIRGHFVAFEVKTPGGQHKPGELTTLQRVTIQRIRDAKGEAFKVTSLQEVREIVENLNF